MFRAAHSFRLPLQLLMAKIMDDSPVLIMSFQAQQATCVRDKTGAIREGGEVGGAIYKLIM